MDHWGDPWADNNVEQQSSPNKDAVIAPQPPTLAPAPVLLNGVLDDAGWGNEDESFGDWTASSGLGAAAVSHAETQPSPSNRLSNDRVNEDLSRWVVDERAKENITQSDRAWAEQKPDSSGLDNGTSDTSETSTTVPADTDVDANVETKHQPNRSQPDEDSSARPSTSQSETNHHGVLVDSSRTSLEEEHVSGKHSAEETASTEEHGGVDKHQSEEQYDVSSSETGSTEDGYGTSTADTLLTEGPQSQNDVAELAGSDSKEDVHETTGSQTEPTVSPPTITTATPAPPHKDDYHLDTSLLDELFPPQKSKAEPDDAPEDPVYSTSARKAWYRLTRKQTMREFNSGNSDDSYIRVTWLGSQIRSEVHKTVARWAREDRMSGTGPGAGASFYWDTAAPLEPKIPKIPKGHQRTKTSVPTQRVAAPMRQSLPAVATNTAAAFNWSSPVSAVNPWKQESPVLQSTVSPAISTPAPVHNEQTQEFRAASMDLAAGVGEAKKRPSVISLETPAVASQIPPPPAATTSWGNPNAAKTNTTVPEQRANVPDDDDDDWGEMISSPTVSIPVSAFPSSIPAPPDNTVSSFTPAPETSLIQDPSADAMHAASIVRLKSTISPTSAIFGRKSFVPLGAEPGPIGPGILKPAKRPAVSVPEKLKDETPSEPLPKVLPDVQDMPEGCDVEKVHEVRTHDPKPSGNDAEDGFSSLECSTPQPEVAQLTTPPQPPVQTEPITDSWADADFSIFESAPTTASAHAQPKHDPLDSFSIFRTPPRPASAASSAKTFTRSSPPRNVTPPAMQPLTGATNSAQRRKNEEERIIKDILAGLPDLSYMLR